MLLALPLAIMFGIVALTFVLVPLYRQRPLPQVQTTQAAALESGVGAVTERERAARSALQEIELDYQLGNISQEDYNTLRERYTRLALVALKLRHERGTSDEVAELDTLSHRAQELDDLIEEQLRTLKEQRTDATD